MSRFPELFRKLPETLCSKFDPANPWQLIQQVLDSFLEELPEERLWGVIDRRAILVGSRIVVEKGARIGAGVVLQGPVFVGEGASIEPGAIVRGGAYVGDEVLIGSSSLVSRAVLLPGVEVAGLSSVANAVLGRQAMVGVGTVLGTSEDLLGATGTEAAPAAGPGPEGSEAATLLGDQVRVGSKVVVSRGALVGCESEIASGVVLPPGIYPERVRIGLRQGYFMTFLP